MRLSFTKSLAAILLCTGVLSLAGCNTFKGTIHGAEQDMHQLDQSLNPSSKQSNTTTSQQTQDTTNALTSKIDATNAPIEKKTDSDIPEESY